MLSDAEIRFVVKSIYENKRQLDAQAAQRMQIERDAVRKAFEAGAKTAVP